MSENQNNVATATGSPAGFMCMAFYLAVLCPMLIGIASPDYGVLLIPFGFIGMVVQLIVGTVDLKRGDILSGNITLAFSAFMAFGAILTLLKLTKISPLADTSFVEGFVFLVMGVIMVLLTGPALKAFLALGLFNVVTDAFFFLMAFGGILKMPVLNQIAGYCLIGSIITLVWTSCGITLNTAVGGEAIPLGAPLVKPAPGSGVTA